MENLIAFLTPKQAWERLHTVRAEVYDPMNALYTGDHALLQNTARAHSFWARKNKGRIHVPIAADIAATSANLLFGKEPTFTLILNEDELQQEPQQQRFEAILDANSFDNKLTEGAETAAALGDVYFKVRWDDQQAGYPLIDIVQPDQAYPEYRLGKLACIHFFTAARYDEETQKVLWLYELYEPGKLTRAAFEGTPDMLGTDCSETVLPQLGITEPEIETPVKEMLATHVANMRPNRGQRFTMLGRSDLAGLRDLCDALDETYTSWIRDIRLSKARLIVPADYLKRKPQEMLDGLASSASWEFDPDMETYVAMDINSADDKAQPITQSQFAIRTTEHAETCTMLVQNILTLAGYSPQTFGLEILGSAQSGTALEVRERKSSMTRDKKQTYWMAPLEDLLEAMVKLDAVLYPGAGSDGLEAVRMRFADSMGETLATLAQTVQSMFTAKSASVETRVRTLHPDWTEVQVVDEIDRIKQEEGMEAESPLPDYALGDGETDADTNE